MEEEVTFKIISREELLGQYNDHLFWYLYDEKRKRLIASPSMNGMQDLCYAFVKRSDAESLRYILTKSPAYQDDHKRSTVISNKWPAIDASTAATLGEFAWVGIEPEQAKILFSYIKKDIPLTEEQEEELKDLSNFADIS